MARARVLPSTPSSEKSHDWCRNPVVFDTLYTLLNAASVFWRVVVDGG
ncbi:MAG: hypothetical protein ACP5R4_03445 [Armatimonadota bacterium]